MTRPTKWDNPFRQEYTEPLRWVEAYEVVDDYIDWLKETPEGRAVAEAAKVELRGHDLACWCYDGEPCHADVLLRIANEGVE